MLNSKSKISRFVTIVIVIICFVILMNLKNYTSDFNEVIRAVIMILITTIIISPVKEQKVIVILLNGLVKFVYVFMMFYFIITINSSQIGSGEERIHYYMFASDKRIGEIYINMINDDFSSVYLVTIVVFITILLGWVHRLIREKMIT